MVISLVAAVVILTRLARSRGGQLSRAARLTASVSVPLAVLLLLVFALTVTLRFDDLSRDGRGEAQLLAVAVGVLLGLGPLVQAVRARSWTCLVAGSLTAVLVSGVLSLPCVVQR